MWCSMPDSRSERVVASRSAARAQAHSIVAALERDDPALLSALMKDPFAALEAHAGVVVRVVPEAQTDGGCSVAGAYLAQETPPVLVATASASVGRRRFTLLHEFGHHLQQTQVSLMTTLLTEPDRGSALEDAACDAFAAAILLPESLIAAHFDPRGPTSDDVVGLWQSSGASRAAVCVRASESLPSPGHVLLLDDDGVVEFAASHGLPPVRRGSSQGQIPVVRNALYDPRRHAAGRTRIAYRDGIRGCELHAQAADMGGHLVVVAVMDNAPWQRFSPPSLDNGPQARSWTCEHCGHEFAAFDRPCGDCKAPACPECGRCSCRSRVEERRCDTCFLVLPVSAFDGQSRRCVNCS
ncbi:MAG: Peptidase protein [Actinomycetota bacterium]|nr:Peptidase protein [Actinomycetota bacterium]